MKVLSVNVGRPRVVLWKGEAVRTSIFKSPVAGPVRVGRLDLAGDEQADLSVHGGPGKAVYAYPAEHYAWWRAQLPEADLPWGAFGENLTTEGLSESDLRIGDHLRAGSAELVVTQPRMPCYKLGLRFGSEAMVQRFLDSRRSGFYLAVLTEGWVQAGDAVERTARAEASLTVTEIVDLYVDKAPALERLRRAAALPDLPESWRKHFDSRLRSGRKR